MRTIPWKAALRSQSQRPLPARQRGVVLIIALVVLVAMSLGGVAIMRSVDTSALIAGNIAFKQRTLAAADAGIETAIKWISDNRLNLNTDNAGAGYFSSLSRTVGRFAWETDAAWAGAKLVGEDAAGNTVHYVIHRMCTLAGQSFNATDQSCATDTGATDGTISAPAEGASSVAGAPGFTAPPRVYLRVTVRSTGPRNAKSYVQAMVLVPVPL